MCLTWVFFTWAIVAWLTFVGRLTYHRFMALCANLSLLHGSPLSYGHRQDMVLFVCFRHTSDVFGRGTLWLINPWFANSLCWVFIVNVRHMFILNRTTNNSLLEYIIIYYHKYYAMSSTGNISLLFFYVTISAKLKHIYMNIMVSSTGRIFVAYNIDSYTKEIYLQTDP